jgi:hypothetical protein
MAKRTIAGDGKKVPLNMRTTAALRAKINKAAGKSGRSLVQEVEYRVERSFHGDDALREIDRIRGHITGMLNVLDGKLERLCADISAIARGQHATDAYLAAMRERQGATEQLLADLVNGNSPPAREVWHG